MNVPQEIENLEHRWTKAIQTMDVDAIMAFYHPDESSVYFDIPAPLRYLGTAAWRRNWETFFSKHLRSIEKAEASHIKAEGSGDVGYAALIQHYALTDLEGNRREITCRISHGLRKVGGKWLIVHEHSSFPIDWKSGRADPMAPLSKP